MFKSPIQRLFQAVAPDHRILRALAGVGAETIFNLIHSQAEVFSHQQAAGNPAWMGVALVLGCTAIKLLADVGNVAAFSYAAVNCGRAAYDAFTGSTNPSESIPPFPPKNPRRAHFTR